MTVSRNDKHSEIIDRIIYFERKAMESRVAYTTDQMSYTDYRSAIDLLINEQRRLKEFLRD